MKKIIDKTFTLFLFFCCLIGVFGCDNQIEQSSQDIFDNKDITIEFLKENNGVFLDDYVFIKGQKNHVFRTKDNKIIDHKSFPLVNFEVSNYDDLCGKNIYDTVKKIGCPTFLGIKSKATLDYSNTDYKVRRLHLEKNNGNYIVKNVEVIEKDSTRAYEDSDAEKPSFERAKNLKSGMCIDDVILTLGTKLNPNDFTSNLDIYNWKVELDNGNRLEMMIGDSFCFDCEHHIFDSSNLYSAFYEYLYHFRIVGTDIIDNGSYRDYLPIYIDDNDDRFMDDSKISIEYLKQNKCFFYNNYIFASDKKNHVFKLENNQIVNHKIYNKISYPLHTIELFNSCKDMNFENTFELIGIPTFSLEKDSTNLTYVLPNNKMISMNLVEKDGALFFKDNAKLSSWCFIMDVWADKNRTSLVSDDELSFIAKGMCVADVCSIIGRPNKMDKIEINNSLRVFHYPYKENKEIILTFEYDRITKECNHAIKMDDFGYDEINREYVHRNYFYLYLKDISISNISG